MAEKIGFKKKSGTEVGRVGCPWTAHFWVSGLLKSVSGLCEMDQNRPYVVCLNC